ncbi:CRTAC1 family protein [Gymnodinialimonas sp. 2305UL16-5]|uniref:CRTAC1 family protein n=1 Tax=Gymnodinialimonas mytili TaxID=3126503 RepID=UPI00309AC975
MRRSAIAVALLAALPATAQPAFEPRPLPSHIYTGGWEHFVGGGLAAFDCSGDGLPELYAAGGSNPGQLFLNGSEPGGDLTFARTESSGLEITGVIGAYPLDIDSDGVLDLAVLRVGDNLLLRGTGDCRFAPMEIGFQSGEAWSTAFSATWEAGAELPTLAIGNYVDRADPEGPFGTCDANRLYRPEGDAYAAPLALEPGFCALSMLFTDWARTGRPDLRVSNDRHYYVRGGEEQLWAMEDTPRLYGPEDGWASHQLWGMGIASRDLDRDGLAEVYLTSMGDQRLQIREGDGPSYVDARYEQGATAHRPYTGGDGRPSTGWHAAFGDVDNDGWSDLFVTKGNVEQMPGSAMDDPNNLLMGGAEGVFTEAGLEAGIASLHRGRGGALVDLNADGRLDIAVVNRGAEMELFQNVTPDIGHWLAVLPLQEGPNRFAIGAHVELRAGDALWVQEITVGGGHAGGVAGPLHFGIGAAEMVDIRVIWPEGAVSDWPGIAADQTVTLTR